MPSRFHSYAVFFRASSLCCMARLIALINSSFFVSIKLFSLVSSWGKDNEILGNV